MILVLGYLQIWGGAFRIKANHSIPGRFGVVTLAIPSFVRSSKNVFVDKLSENVQGFVTLLNMTPVGIANCAESGFRGFGNHLVLGLPLLDLKVWWNCFQGFVFARKTHIVEFSDDNGRRVADIFYKSNNLKSIWLAALVDLNNRVFRQKEGNPGSFPSSVLAYLDSNYNDHPNRENRDNESRESIDSINPIVRWLTCALFLYCFVLLARRGFLICFNYDGLISWIGTLFFLLLSVLPFIGFFWALPI